MVAEVKRKPGALVSRATPFIYLPKSVQKDIGDIIDRAIECSIALPFRQKKCRGVNSCKCWQAQVPSGDVNGLKSINIEASIKADVGGTLTLLWVRGFVKVVQVGVITGTAYGSRKCPTPCIDDYFGGHMSLVLEGSLDVSSELVSLWNKNVLSLWVWSVLFGQPEDKLLEDYQEQVSGQVFKYQLGGKAGRAVYDLGPFRLSAR